MGDLLDESEDLAHALELPTRSRGRRSRAAAAGDFQFDLGFALAGGVGQDGAQTVASTGFCRKS